MSKDKYSPPQSSGLDGQVSDESPRIICTPSQKDLELSESDKRAMHNMIVAGRHASEPSPTIWNTPLVMRIRAYTEYMRDRANPVSLAIRTNPTDLSYSYFF